VTLASDDAAVREHAMNGEWTIGFGEDGILDVTAPADFSGTRTGYSFQLTDSQLRTDLFSADVCTGLLPGTYRWQVIDRSLTLTVDEDPCRGRVALLTGGSWRATDGGQ